MDEIDSDPIGKIDFSKYLNCPGCIVSGLYCDEHKKEVEKYLAENNG